MSPAPHFPKEKYSSRPEASLDFQDMLMHAPIGCFQSTPEGKFIFVNHAMARIHGYDSPLDMLQWVTDIKSQLYVDPADREKIKHILEEQEEIINHECRIRRRDGNLVWVSLSIRALLDSNGVINQWQGFVTDITLRKLSLHLLEQKRKALAKSEELYRGLVESQHDFIVRLDLQDRLVYVNETFCRSFGKSRQEFLGNSFVPLVHENDIEETFRAMESLKVPPYRAKAQLRAWTVDGWRWFLWEGSGIFDQNGQMVEIQGIGRDITEIKTQQLKLESIFEACKDIAFIIAESAPEGDLRITDFSPGAESVHGYQKQEVMGESVAILHSREDLEKFPDIYGSIRQGRVWRGSMFMQRKNGQVFPALFTVYPLEIEDRLSALGVAVDISELEEIRRALQKAKEAAEAASQAKSNFLANMSHEIRTPLNIIMGFTQVLERDASLSRQHLGQVQTISRNADNLLRTLNDILDMSSIEAGQVRQNAEDFDLHHFYEQLRGMFLSRADSRGLELSFELDGDIPRYVHGDQGMLRQIFINLLENALKFTAGGWVKCNVKNIQARSAADDSPDVFRLEFRVEDTGPGISSEELKNLFEPFYQTVAGIKKGGTGLGLAISLRYSRIMGGDLWYENREGGGSCFCLQIPMLPACRPCKDFQEKPLRMVSGLAQGSAPVRVLVVDDKQDNRSMLLALLKPLGFKVREAAEGAEALQVFEHWLPHAVLMDMRMPVMDGYETTRRIRLMQGGEKVCIIAVTASVAHGHINDILAQGVDYYLGKPFKPDELLDIFKEALGLSYTYSDMP
ncbi:PAS domain S-box protein [Desulfonatronospira sp.]|uniref:PAS domain-containing hybrid sensor histidine kinase/response regulator n=2 Tax=Desulfonatronospira sp. TaxID=1962951 RepID=UPI0025C47F74|nr:PAS domain S-box protein [Desulfonatronospira sp.]